MFLNYPQVMISRPSAALLVADGTVIQQRAPAWLEIIRISALPNLARTALESITEVFPVGRIAHSVHAHWVEDRRLGLAASVEKTRSVVPSQPVTLARSQLEPGSAYLLVDMPITTAYHILQVASVSRCIAGLHSLYRVLLHHEGSGNCCADCTPDARCILGFSASHHSFVTGRLLGWW